MARKRSTADYLLNLYKDTYKPVTHIIFECDGVLLDTEEIAEKCYKLIASEFNAEVPFEIRCKAFGINQTTIARIFIKELKLPISVDEFIFRYELLSREFLDNAPLIKGAAQLISNFHKDGIPMCMITSSNIDETELKIENHEKLFQLLNHKVCAASDSQVKLGKPSPEIFLVAASRFADKPEPSQCLVFEHSVAGIRGANAAGMQAVMLPDIRLPMELREDATLVLSSLEDFKPEHFGLPAHQVEVDANN